MRRGGGGCVEGRGGGGEGWKRGRDTDDGFTKSMGVRLTQAVINLKVYHIHCTYYYDVSPAGCLVAFVRRFRASELYNVRYDTGLCGHWSLIRLSH